MKVSELGSESPKAVYNTAHWPSFSKDQENKSRTAILSFKIVESWNFCYGTSFFFSILEVIAKKSKSDVDMEAICNGLQSKY